jgi:hypothetical protein
MVSLGAMEATNESECDNVAYRLCEAMIYGKIATSELVARTIRYPSSGLGLLCTAGGMR